MKTIGQVVDELDLRIAVYARNVLSPGRRMFLREEEIIRHDELVSFRDFIVKDGTDLK